ncbi:MAG TPA: hypothetical protein VHL77_12960, partial [Ferruginibacter sp.]|nr:hypothetical protein [Ferruginibacter sp.]
MKSSMLSRGLFALPLLLLSIAVDAQRPSRQRGQTTTPPATSPPVENKPPSRSLADIYPGIPIRVDSSSLNTGVAKPGQRPYYSTVSNGDADRTPLTPEFLRKDDALYGQMVWRELDLNEKMNQSFNYNAEFDQGSEIFADILLNAVINKKVEAFADERFTTPLTVQEIEKTTLGTWDTIEVKNPNNIDGPPLELRVTRASFDAKSVKRLR